MIANASRRSPGVGLLLVLAAVAAACGRRDTGAGGAGTDTAQTAPAAPDTAGRSAAPAPAAPTAAPTAAAPATGRTVDVRMLGDAKGYRFEPANVTIHVGDAVRWTNVSGGPHNVTFWPDSVPAGAQAPLQANMPNTTSTLAGPLLTTPNATYVISFAGAKPGVYSYYCTPHLALGMKARITVQ